MNFDELVSVLVPKLFCQCRAFLSRSSTFLEHAGEFFLIVLSII